MEKMQNAKKNSKNHPKKKTADPMGPTTSLARIS